MAHLNVKFVFYVVVKSTLHVDSLIQTKFEVFMSTIAEISANIKLPEIVQAMALMDVVRKHAKIRQADRQLSQREFDNLVAQCAREVAASLFWVNVVNDQGLPPQAEGGTWSDDQQARAELRTLNGQLGYTQLGTAPPLELDFSNAPNIPETQKISVTNAIKLALKDITTVTSQQLLNAIGQSYWWDGRNLNSWGKTQASTVSGNKFDCGKAILPSTGKFVSVAICKPNTPAASQAMIAQFATGSTTAGRLATGLNSNRKLDFFIGGGGGVSNISFDNNPADTYVPRWAYEGDTPNTQMIALTRENNGKLKFKCFEKSWADGGTLAFADTRTIPQDNTTFFGMPDGSNQLDGDAICRFCYAGDVDPFLFQDFLRHFYNLTLALYRA